VEAVHRSVRCSNARLRLGHRRFVRSLSCFRRSTGMTTWRSVSPPQLGHLQATIFVRVARKMTGALSVFSSTIGDLQSRQMTLAGRR
jgi:hypothetical protein